jgi:hypothetical protein
MADIFASIRPIIQSEKPTAMSYYNYQPATYVTNAPSGGYYTTTVTQPHPQAEQVREQNRQYMQQWRQQNPQLAQLEQRSPFQQPWWNQPQTEQNRQYMQQWTERMLEGKGSGWRHS